MLNGDFSWSYSGYSTAIQCLRKFQYAYVDKIVQEGPEGGDLVFGSALHSALNSVLTGGDGAATFELYWSMYQDKDVEYGRYKWADLARLGAEFIRKFTRFHAPNYKLVQAEQRLYGSHNGVRLEGTPDYYGEYLGRPSLRDFKTSGRNYDSAKSDCALQLYLYAFLHLRTNPGMAIETLGYTVFNKGTGSIQDLTWEFNHVTMMRAVDGFTEYAKMLGATGFPTNFNSCLDYNRKCEYFDKCHPKEKV